MPIILLQITLRGGTGIISRHVIDAEEYGAALKRVDDKLAKEILSAYSEADDWKDYGTGCKCRVGEHLFKTTRFPHFYEAEVIIGEEEDED